MTLWTSIIGLMIMLGGEPISIIGVEFTLYAEITAYAPFESKGLCADSNTESTSTGTFPTQGRTIAVDPSRIPYGVWIFIPGYGVGKAEDTGGAMRQAEHIKLDVMFDKREDALQWGRRQEEIVIRSDSMSMSRKIADELRDTLKMIEIVYEKDGKVERYEIDMTQDGGKKGTMIALEVEEEILMVGSTGDSMMAHLIVGMIETLADSVGDSPMTTVYKICTLAGFAPTDKEMAQATKTLAQAVRLDKSNKRVM